MVRFALGIEYDGSAYCGWQKQIHCSSVQQELENALSFVANQPIELICAGRTDKGVHACEQVVHFETDVNRSFRSWLMGTNTQLPRDIRVIWIEQVSNSFHARFSAIARSYRYIILNSSVPSALFHNKVSWQHQQLDENLMREASKVLLGEHDFSAFRAAGCQAKTPIRTIESLSVSRHQNFIFIDIKANAFLHHMVRNIAGSLIEIGKAEQKVSWLEEVLLSKDRRQAAMTAAAGGLYFVQAFYPAEHTLPQVERRPVLF